MFPGIHYITDNNNFDLVSKFHGVVVYFNKPIKVDELIKSNQRHPRDRNVKYNSISNFGKQRGHSKMIS